MAWKLDLDSAAERDLGQIDPQIARRILAFLHDRVATLDDPRSIGPSCRALSKVSAIQVRVIFRVRSLVFPNWQLMWCA